jgi:hypothetical protein
MFDYEILLQLWDSADLFGKVIIVFLAIHPVASTIVAATPTPVDDKWYGMFYNMIVRPLALNVFKAAQPKPEKK